MAKKQKIVADEFKIPANSVSTIMKRKEHYKQQFFSGQVDASKQRVRLANHDDVESELLRWFTEMRGNNIPIDGPMMKTKATSIAHALGKDWECNEGWLSRFKHRRNIVFKTLCGEFCSQRCSIGSVEGFCFEDDFGKISAIRCIQR